MNIIPKVVSGVIRKVEANALNSLLRRLPRNTQISVLSDLKKSSIEGDQKLVSHLCKKLNIKV